ncbi:MAG: acyl-CoA dehydrogenase family protein [Myxococcota bacterium]
MNFDLSEEQEMLQETVRKFLENECPVTTLREIFDGDTGFSESLWKGMAEMGLAGLHLPDEYGGAGLEILDLAIVSEVLGYMGTPGPFVGHALAGLAIATGGSDAQKQKWLAALATGDAIGTVALAEEGGAWLPDQWSLEGGSLTGSKNHVLFAEQADVIVVGVAGGGLALVEKDAEGVEIKDIESADRTRRLCQVSFADTPSEALPEGEAAATQLRDVALVLLAADAFGGASRLVEMSVEYAKTREQFGVTIGHFQALKHQLANMAVEVEPARGLYWYAAHAMDHVHDESERTAAVAKAHITDRYMQVARDAVEAHGGIGFTWECDVQIWFKRAMFDRAFLGTPDVHRARAADLAGW